MLFSGLLLGKKRGQKIRAWVDLPPPLIRAMPERKRFFSSDVFPKVVYKAQNISFLLFSVVTYKKCPNKSSLRDHQWWSTTPASTSKSKFCKSAQIDVHQRASHSPVSSAGHDQCSSPRSPLHAQGCSGRDWSGSPTQLRVREPG